MNFHSTSTKIWNDLIRMPRLPLHCPHRRHPDHIWRRFRRRTTNAIIRITIMIVISIIQKPIMKYIVSFRSLKTVAIVIQRITSPLNHALAVFPRQPTMVTPAVMGIAMQTSRRITTKYCWRHRINIYPHCRKLSSPRAHRSAMARAKNWITQSAMWSDRISNCRH